jgi:hypothetical protein
VRDLVWANLATNDVRYALQENRRQADDSQDLAIRVLVWWLQREQKMPTNLPDALKYFRVLVTAPT